MLESLLQTKLYIPSTRPDFVPRPRLIERLNAGLQRKLTLISAPAGSGKTTLISNWVHDLRFTIYDLPSHDARKDQITNRVAWLSLEETDNDLVRFWAYFVAAIQTAQPDVGQTALAVLLSPGLGNGGTPPIENLLTNLINEIATLTEQIILVLDDFHLINAPQIGQTLNFVLDHLPPQLHLVIIAREDPSLPLARLRVRQQMTEFRVNDLHFTTEETAQFLNQALGLNLPAEAIAVLARRTEGWAAGLQMAALSMQALADPRQFIEDFAGDDRFVVDYLLAEVLDRQPSHVLSFLHQTSILKRFTAALCEAVTGQSDSGEILTYLEEANLFLVALDNRRAWYRYHHLFGDLLYYRFAQTDPDRLPKTHRLASRWYQEQGFIDDAVFHALAGQDYDYAADLIEQVGLKMVGQARLNRLQQWIESLPESLIAKRPYLPVLLAWVDVLTRQPDQAESHLALAEREAENLSDNSSLKLEVVCQIALLWGYVARLRSDLPASIAHIQQAIQFLPDDNEFLACTANLNLGGNYWGQGNFAVVEAPWRKALTFLNSPHTTYPALVAAGYLANAYLQRGQLEETKKLCQHIEQTLGRRPPPAIAYLAIEQGALCYEQNDLTAATEALSQAVRLGENLDRIVNIGRALLLLAWIKHVAGQTDEAASLIERANANQPPNMAEFDYYRVRLWLMQGNLPAADQWAKAYEQQPDEDGQWQALRELTFAHTLLADKQVDRALEVLTQCEASTQAAGAMGWVIRSLALKAMCYQAMNDINQALFVLQQALDLAEPQGYIRTFVDFGPPMQQLLQRAVSPSVAPDYVTTLLTAFSPPHTPSPLHPLSPAPQPLIEPLSDRERQVLRLLANGLSNQEIADALIVSVNTVRTHLRRIYAKLAVSSRTAAVNRAQALELL